MRNKSGRFDDLMPDFIPAIPGIIDLKIRHLKRNRPPLHPIKQRLYAIQFNKDLKGLDLTVEDQLKLFTYKNVFRRKLYKLKHKIWEFRKCRRGRKNNGTR